MTDPAAAPARSRRLIAPGAILAVLAGAAAALALLYHAYALERERELVTWQVRTAAVAEGQATAVSAWLERRFTALQALADNASLQIYLSELAQGSQSALEAAAQREYLGQLLAFSATRSGFAEIERPASAIANEHPAAHSGLALFSAERKVLVATSGIAWGVDGLGSRIAALPRAQRALVDELALPDGTLAVGFVEPVFAVDSAGARDRRLVGYVAGVTPIGADLFADLAIAAPYPVAASTLVRTDGGMIQYLSPDPGSSRPSGRRVSAAATGLDAAFAASQPGAFAERRDFRGEPVLTTGRAIAGTGWTIVHSIPLDAAMAGVDTRARYMALAIALGAMLAVAAVVAAWRHGATRRLTGLAADYKELARRYERERERLGLITDAQSDVIVAVDGEGQVQFANRAFRDRVGLPGDALLGKRFDALLGPAAAAAALDVAARATAAGGEVRETTIIDQRGTRRIVHLTAVPLEARGSPLSALIVERDVSDMLVERTRREPMLSQLVATLARGVATQLHVDAPTAVAAEMTGRLMMFEKILVPSDVLSGKGPLDADQRARVHRSIADSARILTSAAADDRVADALTSVAERWDGGGPRGLRSAEIPLAAQIAAAANFFMESASAHAYGPERGISHAIAEIQAESDKRFDRRIISSLANFIDNEGGRPFFAAEEAP